MTDLTVANTILAQLGGNRFIAMTGARSFVGSDNALMFGLPRGAKNKANKVRVTLCADDTYKVEFFYIRGAKVFRAVSEQTGVYCDQLRAVFTAATGLDCTL